VVVGVAWCGAAVCRVMREKEKKKMEKRKKNFLIIFFFFSFRISTLVLLSLVANAQGGLFDTLFGVFNTVKNNNWMIQLGCASAFSSLLSLCSSPSTVTSCRMSP
jgi:ABC-type Mn2+/Zn2+ transport system permease subunit